MQMIRYHPLIDGDTDGLEKVPTPSPAATAIHAGFFRRSTSIAQIVKNPMNNVTITF